MHRRTTLWTVLSALTVTAVTGPMALAAPAPTLAPANASATASAPSGDSDLERSLQGAAEPLRTPFERSNGATWTSFAQWRSFWADLDARSERVRVSTVGRSGKGRPIDLVTIGHPAPPTAERAAKGSVLLLNCSIHGDEPSGRESCMSMGRDLATTTDPHWQRFLARTTVLLIDINPDGWVANTRTNAAGIDVNRDFLDLKSSEARTLVRVIGDWKPDVLNDLHEYGPREFYDTQSLTLWPRNLNIDQRVYRQAKAMVQRYTSPRIEAGGMTDGVYGQLVKDGVPFQQVAGDGQGRILRNYSGLRHIVGQLTEAANEPVTAAEKKDPALTNRRRVAVQYASSVGSAELIMERRDAIARTTTGAADRGAAQGKARAGVVYFGGQDDMIPTKAAEVEAKPMCGYALTSAQASSLREVLDLHGVTVKKTADGAFVPMAQSMRGLIPLLLDKRSEFKIAEATPVATCPAG